MEDSTMLSTPLGRPARPLSPKRFSRQAQGQEGDVGVGQHLEMVVQVPFHPLGCWKTYLFKTPKIVQARAHTE